MAWILSSITAAKKLTQDLILSALTSSHSKSSPASIPFKRIDFNSRSSLLDPLSISSMTRCTSSTTFCGTRGWQQKHGAYIHQRSIEYVNYYDIQVRYFYRYALRHHQQDSALLRHFDTQNHGRQHILGQPTQIALIIALGTRFAAKALDGNAISASFKSL